MQEQETLKEYLKKHGYTLRAAAQKCGVHYSTIQRAAQKETCTIQTARALIKGLNIPLDEANRIFFETSDMERTATRRDSPPFHGGCLQGARKEIMTKLDDILEQLKKINLSTKMVYTQKELADYLGIARMTYVRYEAYERMMPVDLFLRIADLAKIEDVRTIRFK